MTLVRSAILLAGALAAVGFDAGTALAEGDGRAEDLVMHHADHQLAAVGLLDHGFDGDAVDVGIRAVLLHTIGDLHVGVTYGGEAVQVEAYAA